MMKHPVYFSSVLKKVTIQRWLLYSVAIAMALAGLSGCGSNNGSGVDSGVTSFKENAVTDIQIKTLSNRADLISGGDALAVTDIQIKTLSNRADLISGGDALMEIILPSGISFSSLSVDVDGRDVTSAFAVRSGGRITGVVTGFINGNNIVHANATGTPSVKLTVTNHPIGGPILSGPQVTPWVCATPTTQAENGNTPQSNASGLSTYAVDSQCNIATETHLYYRDKRTEGTGSSNCSFVTPDPSPAGSSTPSNSCFQPYVPGTTPASSVASTTTSTGLVVPYIVRVERGTINRGIYDIAVLYDPTKPTWTATSPQPQWNGKVVYGFGGGGSQTRLQSRSGVGDPSWYDNQSLKRGFMVVDNSLTDGKYNSNRIVTVETAMMMKEYIVDHYGEIKYMMGSGCSQGANIQNTIASVYPGLLDGIQTGCSYSDSPTEIIEIADCLNLVTAYSTMGWTGWSPQNNKKTAINGHLDQTSCHAWFNFNGGGPGGPGNFIPNTVNEGGIISPASTSMNSCGLPAALVYNPTSNPTGIRCTEQDTSAAIWGTTAGVVPGTTRALSYIDNVGVQYGLKALIDGKITTTEFVTLNENIGGADADGNPTTARMSADPAALDIAYKSGLVSGGTRLGKLPIIDARGYDETYYAIFGIPVTYGIHLIWRSFAERARIDAANANNHGNHIMYRFTDGLVPTSAAAIGAITVPSLVTMDTWLSNLITSAPKTWINAGERTQAQVISAKPTGARDTCYKQGDTNYNKPIYDMAECDKDTKLVRHLSPREVAGNPLAGDILKCQLKPLVFSDYTGITFTASQQARLRAVFPDGVCDWSKPGVNQQDPIAPLTFAAGPGGQPLGDPPVSTLK